MTDISFVLPQFPLHLYTDSLSSLERNAITTADLITLDVVETAKRSQLSTHELSRLRNHLIEDIQVDLGLRKPAFDSSEGIFAFGKSDEEQPWPRRWAPDERSWRSISFLDSVLDDVVGGGLPTKHLIEITGESGAGKTQCLLTLLLAVQLPPPQGLGQQAIYVTTEGALATLRLQQLISNHPSLRALSETSRPSLDAIHVVPAKDLETQDHILEFGLPPAVRNYKAGLVVIDSIAANFRSDQGSSAAKDLADRHTHLVRLGRALRKLAREENIAVVVANQVSDRLEHILAKFNSGQPFSSSSPSSSSPGPVPLSSPATAETDWSIMTLDHQQLFFSGWGDDPHGALSNMKTPALGLSWTNQISCRIALKLEAAETLPTSEMGYLGNNLWRNRRKRRFLKLVFAPWTIQTKEVELEIKKEGIFAIGGSELNMKD
ncbi:MAG: hypothetical protein Q9160_007167 [Pyrenula sp. 1 TL-2023]